MKRSILILFLIMSLTTLLSCQTNKLETKNLEIAKADGTIVTVKAEIADTEETRNYGFMNRKHIPDGTGMLFIFDYDQLLAFWMKNTPHPLSIAYIDAKGQIRDIFDMTPFSLAPIYSTTSVRYALEVPQGWFEKVGVNVGDTINLNY